jgi:cytochrome b561
MNDTRPPFDSITMCFHWLTLALIASLFVTAWMHDSAHTEAGAAALLQTHRSLGLMVWVVSVARLAWRRTGAYLPPFPKHMSTAQQLIAKASEYVLYALLLVQPLTGMAQTVLRGRGFDVFLTHVGPVLARDRALEHAFHDIHEIGGTLFLIVIGLHASAALVHHFFWKDGVLRSMLPLSAPRLSAPDLQPANQNEDELVQ